MKSCLARTSGRWIVGLFVVLLGLALFPWEAQGPGGHGRAPGGQATTLLLEARIETLAELTGRSPEQLRNALNAQGIQVSSDSVTLAEAARQSHTPPLRALAAVLQGTPEARGAGGPMSLH